MEESGENWSSDLEKCEEVILEDGDYDSLCDETEDRFNRKKRNERELEERLLELSAAIGLKKRKLDKASILEKAKHYVKKLQDRVKELEQEVGSNNYGTSTSILPDVKTKMLQKEILLTIHCEKQKSVMLKILTKLKNLHLSIVSSSVLQFGKSTFDITIVAQMGDGYNITMDELVKTLTIVIMTK
ncbi:transcription factor bHLH25-like [Vicia villosa]|uniref:transcription factor bHLH25-like n=1 Tax=Vicia villosa TaxID=3911 RepID=UPI00273CC9FC|nr:transcription factor bHLH25-like [Vicia villosa]